LRIVVGSVVILLSFGAPMAIGLSPSAGALTPNPTTGSANGVILGEVQAWSNGLTVNYQANYGGVGAQYIQWQNNVTFLDGTSSFDCSGSNASIFVPLPPGVYEGAATLQSSFPTAPSIQYVLAVSGSTPAPITSNTCSGTPQYPLGQGHVDAPVVGMASTPDGQGYYIVGTDGTVQAFGDATFSGDLTGVHLNNPIVGIAPSYGTNGNVSGYWLVASDGGVFSYGPATFYGSMGDKPLNKPIVGMATTVDGRGYWLVASDGGIFAFGDAQFYGSMGGKPLNEPVVGMATCYSTQGYWLVASDGGIFGFNAPFYGSTGSLHLNKPIEEMEPAPDGSGYRFVAADGGVFSFNLPFEGSLGGNPPADGISGMAASGTNGYWLVEPNGTVHQFGTAPILSSS
jgi:hypothetical protein